jgi:hypothetical protein
MSSGRLFPEDMTSLYLAVNNGTKSVSAVVEVKNSDRLPAQIASARERFGFLEAGFGK